MEHAGIDRLSALHTAIDSVRPGGTVSIRGVHGGAIDPMTMLTMFDKQIQLRMGQAKFHRWIDDVMPLVLDERDPLGLSDFVTHHVPLAAAPDAYKMFQPKNDGAIKVVLTP